MTSIKGQKYQLAGFNITQRGSLVQVFAKFCGVGQDPAQLPGTKPFLISSQTPPQQVPVIYPSLSAQDIVNALVGSDDITPAPGHDIRLPGGAEDLLDDLGPDQFARVLVEIGKAKTAWLDRTETVTGFIPYKPS